MPTRDNRSPLARLSEDLDGPALRQLAQSLVNRIRGPFDPDVEARCALAILRAQSGQLAQARSLLDEARLIDPLNLMSYNLRIQLESQAGAPGEGDRWMRRHARIETATTRTEPLDIDDVEDVLRRIDQIKTKDKARDAADILEDFVFGDLADQGLPAHNVADLYHRLGNMHASLGHAEMAWHCRNTAVLLAPDNLMAVGAFLDSYPSNESKSRVPGPEPTDWDLSDNEEGQSAAKALHDQKITAGRHRAALQRLARLPVSGHAVLDLGESLPSAYTKTLSAKSWWGQHPSVDETPTDSNFRSSRLDLSELPEDQFDRVFLHGVGALRPGIALEAVSRSLRPEGKALAVMGPAWSSAWGHGLQETPRHAPMPHWAHLLWSQAEIERFARTAGVDPSVLKLEHKQPSAQEMLSALSNRSFKLTSLRVVRRTIPLPHVRLKLSLSHPHLDNVFDWGYEVMLEHA